MSEQYSLKQAAEMVGASYSQVWHIYAYRKLQWPRRVGKTFVLNEADLVALKKYLNNPQAGEHHAGPADGRTVQGV